MSSPARWLGAIGLLGSLLLLLNIHMRTKEVMAAQTHRPVVITRLYTGSDGQTHAEQFEANFTAGSVTDISKMMQVNGAELHRASPGSVADWHQGPRRQYVITLSGHGEIEVAGGKKIPMGPGDIELVEDTAGKGHITRVLGNEDRVTLQLPLAASK